MFDLDDKRVFPVGIL